MTLVRAARAFAFGAPLAILAAAFLGPPDPFTQLLYLALGLVLFVPGAYVSVAASGTSRTLLAFFGGILVVMLAGTLVVAALGGGTAIRVVVLVVAVATGALAAMRFG